MSYLYAAYIATWAIHGTYIAIMLRKSAKLRREMQSLSKRG